MSQDDDASSDRRPLNVLIVEDELLIAFDLQMQVEDAGHAFVGHAVDLASCQDLVRGALPDIVLMDMKLRGGDSGADVAGWLRETLDIPCIFVSGNLDDQTREALSALDPVGFVGKPILPSALRAALGDAAARLRPGS